MEKQMEQMKGTDWKRIPRLLLAAPSSGSGKTVITCGLLQAFKGRGLVPAAFKCGPDYIDPMFHREILGVESGNLDGFFQDRRLMQDSFLDGCGGADLAVIEGVMGFFDGLGGVTGRASSWETAAWLDCPVILVADGRGAGLSVAALIQGFLEFQPEGGSCRAEREKGESSAGRAHNGISGILLNRVSPGMYPALKEMLEERFRIPVVGYVPKLDWLHLESRHLGLKLPGEIQDLKDQVQRLAQKLEETVDLDRLLKIAGLGEGPVPGSGRASGVRKMADDELAAGIGRESDERISMLPAVKAGSVTIAVAWDEAFCFYYRDNLKLLRQAGARLEFFSPIHHTVLPGEADGLLLGGGYPELYAESLSENTAMRSAIRQAAQGGMPVLGECGGFLYLQEWLSDEKGTAYPMAGALAGIGFGTGKLGRFGYVTLSARGDSIYFRKGEQIRAHEFHYWDSDRCGRSMEAGKPTGRRNWPCMRQENRILAGFPHLYYPSFPELPKRFVEQCRLYQRERAGRSADPAEKVNDQSETEV